MRLVDRLRRQGEYRATTSALSITDWSKQFRPGTQVSVNGRRYQGFLMGGSGPAGGYYDRNSVVFACTANRLLLFSEARFQFQRLRSGRPGELFGTGELALLEVPWAGATTRDLLTQAELDVTCAGNSYWVRDTFGLLRLDPAKVVILTEAATEQDVTGATVGERIAGYGFQVDRDTMVVYRPDEVAHYKPYPDAHDRFRGMSWLTPCLADVDADMQFTGHKTATLQNGAQHSYVVSMDPSVTPEQFQIFVETYKREHEGPDNAGKTLFLGGGADIKTISQSFEELNLRAAQGATETRIAACAGLPPVIVGLSEGLAAATYSNYAQARRRLVDGTMRPLWGAFAAAISSLVDVPDDCRLWYDDRDIPFLREDVTDQAMIVKEQMLTVEAAVRAGYTPDSAVRAVNSGNLALLEHTGLYSVQLQPPSSGDTEDDTEDDMDVLTD